MFRMYANHSHCYIHLILALGINNNNLPYGVLLLHQTSGIHDVGRATSNSKKQVKPFIGIKKRFDVITFKTT